MMTLLDSLPVQSTARTRPTKAATSATATKGGAAPTILERRPALKVRTTTRPGATQGAGPRKETKGPGGATTIESRNGEPITRIIITAEMHAIQTSNTNEPQTTTTRGLATAPVGPTTNGIPVGVGIRRTTSHGAALRTMTETTTAATEVAAPITT